MNNGRRKDIDAIIALLNEVLPKLEDAKGKTEDTANAEREYYDNMPEGLQQGEKGEQADNAAQLLEEVQSAFEELDLEDLIGKLEEAKG
jgi:hypothetical protein